MPFVPTPEQQLLLEHDHNRHAVLIAGPGTGKSATMVAYIERLVALEPRPRVRLLTFTRAATGELALKANEHPALEAMRPSTIHSFAISALMRNPGAAQFPQPLRMADDWEDQAILRETLARRLNLKRREIDILRRELEANWQSLRPEDDRRIDPQVRARFLGGWREHRQVLGYTMLSELPSLLLEGLRNHEDLVGLDFDLLIVDEYQDLNACDLELLRLLSEDAAILGAGDDDQSIYGFRKAAPQGIRRFLDDYPGAQRYNLTIAKRCGQAIIDWSQFVVEADPARPPKPRLVPDDGAPAGEVALLSFLDNASEARGVATLVHQLTTQDGLLAAEIAILLRSDRFGHFSEPIKLALQARGIAVSDPDLVDRALAEDRNRLSLALLRLVCLPSDDLAWATILHLTDGIGDRFFDHIYERAVANNARFGPTLLAGAATAYEGAPRISGNRAIARIAEVRDWLARNPAPAAPPADGWGHWVTALNVDGTYLGFTNELADILNEIDEIAETTELARFLGQIGPVGSDLAAAKAAGVRIMTMGMSKGLTVRAAILAGAEDGIIPRPGADDAEERRLLYVAMTRARQFMFITWCNRREGPTAFAGAINDGDRRVHSSFLRHGPVATQSGEQFIQNRQR